MERLEVIVSAGELEPGDVVRVTLDGGPKDPERKVVSIKPNNGSGFLIVFQIGNSVWPPIPYHQRFVLVRRPYPDGGRAEVITRIDNDISDVLTMIVEIKRPEYLTSLRKSIEALELGQPPEPEK